MQDKFALLFTGGGARAAYQVGVLAEIKTICEKENIPFPFKIITGCSGGAINAAYLASRVDEPNDAIQKLETLWSNVTSDEIYRSDFSSISRIAFQWASQVMIGQFLKKQHSRLSLLDATPLMTLMSKHINFRKLSRNIHSGYLEGLAISAFNYATGVNEIFYQSKSDITEWQGSHRIGVPTTIGLAHVMASASIPIIFPSVKIKTDFYGDGSLRNYAPLSPALHLGANKVFVIGVVKKNKPRAIQEHHYPSLVRIFGMLLNAALLDASDVDYQISQRINDLLALIPNSKQPFRPIDVFMMSPSEDLGEIAQEHSRKLPRIVKYLLRGMGSNKEGADVLSYLLFTPSFNQDIIELGKKDVHARRDEVIHFLRTPLS